MIFYIDKENTVQFAPRPRHIRVTASFETRRWRLRLTTITRLVKSVAFFAGLAIVAFLAATGALTLTCFVMPQCI